MDPNCYPFFTTSPSRLCMEREIRTGAVKRVYEKSMEDQIEYDLLEPELSSPPEYLVA